MPKLKRSFSALNRRDLLFALLLIAPALTVLLLLSIYPLFYSITISLQTETADGFKWGLTNFTRLISDPFFRTAMAHTFVYAAAALVFEFSNRLDPCSFAEQSNSWTHFLSRGLARSDDAAGRGSRCGLATDAQSKLRRDQRDVKRNRTKHRITHVDGVAKVGIAFSDRS